MQEVAPKVATGIPQAYQNIGVVCVLLVTFVQCWKIWLDHLSKRPKQETSLKEVSRSNIEHTRTTVDSVAKEVDYLKDESSKRSQAFWDTCTRVKSLHDMHNVKDDEGRPIWYFHKSTDTAIAKLSNNVEKLTDVFQQFIIESKKSNN